MGKKIKKEPLTKAENIISSGCTAPGVPAFVFLHSCNRSKHSRSRYGAKYLLPSAVEK